MMIENATAEQRERIDLALVPPTRETWGASPEAQAQQEMLMRMADE